ncbi:MAG: tetratricopeptide repeat protein [Saprospiraceae bacterium]
MKGHNYNDEMEAYLSGKMTSKEEAAFDEIIKNTPELAQDINIMNEIDDVLDNNIKEAAFRNQLNQLGNQYFSENENIDKNIPKKSILSPKWIIGLIAIILITISLWWLNSKSKTQTPEQLFAAYYEPYPAGEITRGNDTEEAYISYYNSGKYDKAASFLEELVSQFPDEDKYQIALGNSYLNVNPSKTVEAIRIFEKVTTKETVYQSTAKWYLAIAYLKNNDKEKALPLLENLAKENRGKYPQLAKSILEKI